MFGRRRPGRKPGSADVALLEAVAGDPADTGARPSYTGKVKGIDAGALAHLDGFAASRRGVEAYVEPVTTVTSLTVVLVAADGEWTRRRIESARDARDLGKRLGIPVYDVHATGYPPRMREWTRAQQAVTRGLTD